MLVGVLYLLVCSFHVALSSVVVFGTVFYVPLTNFTALLTGIEQVFHVL